MIDIKKIVYRNNDSYLIINIGNESTIQYNDIIRPINNSLVIEYVSSLYNLISDWKNKYVDHTVIDGNSWDLSIIFNDGNKKEYSGKAASPANFEAFERLNLKIISEVIYG